MYNSTINGVPLALLLGVTVDTSVLLGFHFDNLPTLNWLSLIFSLNLKKHARTYKVLTADSEVIIYWSLVNPATPDDDNLHVDMSGGESSDILKSRSTMDSS
jgi:hypothetical protein